MKRLLTFAALLLCFLVPASAQVPTTEDSGLLVFAWFDNKPLAEKAMKDVDWAWVKPGLDLRGHTVSVRTWALDPITSTRDKDMTRAAMFRTWFPNILHAALEGAAAGKFKVAEEGEFYLVGRMRECKAGSTAAKVIVGFGAGTEAATFDLALVHHATKEVVAGFHHRIASRSDFSTLDSKAQTWAFGWSRNFVEAAWHPEPPPAPAVAPVAPATQGGTQDLAAELERLKKLHDEKLLTDEEYETLRKKAVAKAQG